MVAEAEGTGEAGPKARIFISYSRKDMAFADRLEAALKARGFEPLIDRTEIYAFEDWWKRIEALIGRADTVVFVLSPDAVASDVALKEVAHAASLNKRFAPIVCRRVEDGAMPEALRRLNFIFFDDPARFEASADRLAEALQTDIGWVRQHTEFGEAARRWSAAGRPGGLLLRSPVLEEAERWIASRPRGAPEPTAETQAFVAESRRGATRRRNILTGSLAAGLVVALALAGLAYWQRRIAVEQRQSGEQQRQRAEDTLAAATKTANSLVFDLAQRFRNTVGIPATLIKDILDRARALQEQLIKSGQVTPDLKRSEADALDETRQFAAGDRRYRGRARRRRAGPANRCGPACRQSRQHGLAARSVGVGQQGWRRAGGAGRPCRRAQVLPGSLAIRRAAGEVRSRQRRLAARSVGVVRKGRRRAGGARRPCGRARSPISDSLAIAERLAKSDPGNAGWQRDLSVSYNKVGDVQVCAGRSCRRAQSYRDEPRHRRAAGEIRSRQCRLAARSVGVVREGRRRAGGAGRPCGRAHVLPATASPSPTGLAKSDPGNAGWQRDLSVSYEKVGDVQMAQGDLAGALKSYRDSLAIAERLAKSDPGNAGWQRDLSVSYNKVGDVQVAQGDLAGALQSYRAGLAIGERLAKSDPGNAGWQRDLSVSYNEVGDVQVAQGNLAGALKSYRDSLAIRERLAQSDPGNTGWQRDLSVSYEKVGDVQVAQGDLAGALKSYRDSLAIAERLAQSDPGNAGWQRDLAAGYAKLADVYGRSNDRSNALAALRQGQGIIARLAKLSPDNAGWKRDQAWFDNQIATLTK